MLVNYDSIAAQFDERYRHQPLRGIEARIRDLASSPGVVRVLEVGCGAGHWLSTLDDLPIELVGVDPSPGMLNQADAHRTRAALVCAPAEALPFEPKSVDLIFCVNAVHHFSNPEKFFRDSRVLLRNGGRLAIFGLDPHAKGTAWYLYEYFAGVRDKDLARYLPHAQFRRLMNAAGFRNVGTDLAEHIRKRFVGADVLNDPFLERTSTSQLLIISEESYRAGRRAIASAIKEASHKERSIRFAVNLMLFVTIGEV